MKNRLRLALVGCAVVTISLNHGASLHAWGREGHRIVARIAARNLSAEARPKLAKILGTTTANLELAMANAATWPDEIDKKTTGTGDWHFIDVPVTGPFGTSGLCPNHACVTDKIDELRGRLAANQTGFKLAVPPVPFRPMTSQEVAFLIHFVGDVHQPLHAATNGDRGGNCDKLTQKIVHSDQTETTELHKLWDVDEVMAVMARHGNAEAQTVSALFQRFKSGGFSVAQASAEDWAAESNDLARSAIYTRLHIPPRTAPAGQCAVGITPVAAGGGYINTTATIAEQRLLAAGIRLSNLLNAICAGNGCKVVS